KKKRGKSGSDQPLQCGPDSKIKLTVVKRDERKVKEALAAFAAAAKAFEKSGGKTGGDEGGARYYYGLAKIAAADKDFEAYLALTFPQNLNFDPDPKKKAIKEKSLKRFNDWVEQKKKVGGEATKKYEGVLAIKDAANSITAAARLGQISQNFSDALFTAQIPQDVRTGEFADEKVEAFCDKMTEVAEPLEAASLNAYSVCLSKSTELGWFSEWSKMCERELGQIKPEEYPSASELRAEPTNVSAIIAVEPPVKLE
ncbi:MAG: hypothetical protein AB7L94_34965, partial [Kofleriaceae bacterium]